MNPGFSLFPATTRGHRDYGWLQANYSFSFGEYHDAERMHFGALRVLNDDTVAPAAGFDWHPHRNMEIITLPLSGRLQHRDSMGHTTVIGAGEVQIMSAGTGVFHSEFNASRDEPVKLLQIWIIPQQLNVTPRYDQVALPATMPDLLTVVGPRENGGLLWMHQQAWLNLARPKARSTVTYNLHDPRNGIYVFVIEGRLHTLGHQLNQRDALGIQQATTLELHAEADSYLLLIEVPLLQ